jgi:hypothetical protein
MRTVPRDPMTERARQTASYAEALHAAHPYRPVDRLLADIAAVGSAGLPLPRRIRLAVRLVRAVLCRNGRGLRR